MTTFDTIPTHHTAPRWSRALRWSGVALVGASWISASAFALYIVAFYLGALAGGRMEQWNDTLPGLYDKGDAAALAGMAVHLAVGAIVLLLGPVQLISSVRRRWPAVHRWLGRVYVTTCGIAGLGGLLFIAIKGTIGGTVMSIGFGLYGLLMLAASVETWRHAAAGRFEIHRVWALRLFALAIGSWLYRMDYGFWLIAMHRIGHLESFHGPFDRVMAFFFYVPNLALVEIYVRAKSLRTRNGVRLAAVAAMSLGALIVAVGTYYFVRFYWGPGIINTLTGYVG